MPTSPLPRSNPVDRYISVLQEKIRYRIIEGNVPNIILLHSFGSSLEIWDPLSEYLHGQRLISLDLIGFGRSGRPDISYQLDIQRRFLLSFMDAVNVDRAVLVGVSMGASIAAWTAAHSPNRVLACVLFAPSGYPGSMWHRWPMTMFYRPGILNRIGQLFVVNKVFARFFPDSLARQALGVTSSYNSSFASAISRIKQPTLLIWSHGDRRVPFSYSTVYLDEIEHSSLLERPAHVGHSVASFAPQDTAFEITRFLRRNKIIPQSTVE